MKKCMFIVPWFGKWPGWFDVFLKTCEINEQFTWLFITNTPPPVSFPDNVTFSNQTLDEFSSVCSNKLKLNVQLHRAYKTCDLRPAYGVIFNEILDQYEYWGYCDLDMLFGKIDNFVDFEKFAHADVITTGKKQLRGHFTICKNIKRVNNAYKLAEPIKSDWLSTPISFERGFEHDKNLLMDEGLFDTCLRKNKFEIKYLDMDRNPGLPVNTHYDSDKHTYMWGDGVLQTRAGERIMCVHFQRWKRSLKDYICKYTYNSKSTRFKIDYQSIVVM